MYEKCVYLLIKAHSVCTNMHGLKADLYFLLQVGPAPRSPFAVLSNGSLVLRPLSKDHQGAWECLASNRVATISASTTILVLGERNRCPLNRNNAHLPIEKPMRQKCNILSALSSAGTSPHAVTSVSVDQGITHANVSWEPGFDGGYKQKYTVWWVTKGVISASDPLHY